MKTLKCYPLRRCNDGKRFSKGRLVVVAVMMRKRASEKYRVKYKVRYYINPESTVYDRMGTIYIIAMTIPDLDGDDGCHRGTGAKNFVAGVSAKCRGIVIGCAGVSCHCVRCREEERCR